MADIPEEVKRQVDALGIEPLPQMQSTDIPPFDGFSNAGSRESTVGANLEPAASLEPAVTPEMLPDAVKAEVKGIGDDLRPYLEEAQATDIPPFDGFSNAGSREATVGNFDDPPPPPPAPAPDIQPEPDHDIDR